jgi:hypothetical protein
MARLGRFFPCMSICLVIFVAEQYISAHARKTKTTGSEHFSAGDETYRQDFAAIWNSGFCCDMESATGNSSKSLKLRLSMLPPQISDSVVDQQTFLELR